VDLSPAEYERQRLEKLARLAQDPKVRGAFGEVHRLRQVRRTLGLARSDHRSRPVVAMNAWDANGQPIIWRSVAEVAEWAKVLPSTVCASLSRKYAVRGIELRYADQLEGDPEAPPLPRWLWRHGRGADLLFPGINDELRQRV
jgi:hypothetical protein